MPSPRSSAILLLLAAACGRAVEHDPARLAAADTMPVAGVDTVWSTDSPASAAPAEAPRIDPEPEPRPGAIGCTRVDPPPSTAPTPPHGYRRLPARFSCVVREGRAPMEARVDVDPAYGYAIRVRMPDPGDARRWTEVLDTAAESQPWHDGYPVVEAVDFDQDGWGDLKLMEYWGATGNLKYHVWRFDPRRVRFVADSVLSDTRNPAPLPGRPPCVRGSSHGGGVWRDTWKMCLRDGTWIDVESESQYVPQGKPFLVRERRERRGGRMVVIHADTTPYR